MGLAIAEMLERAINEIEATYGYPSHPSYRTALMYHEN